MQYVDLEIPYKKEGYLSMRGKGSFVTNCNTPRNKKFQICYSNIPEDSYTKVTKIQDFNTKNLPL